MNVFVFVYDGFAQFEVILAMYFLQTKLKIKTIGLNTLKTKALEGFTVLPDISINDVDTGTVDLLIIPGGDPKELSTSTVFYDFLKALHKKNKKIAAICSAVLHLANTGILFNKKYTTTLKIEEHDIFDKQNYLPQTVVNDGNIITAKSNGYVDFALELGKVMNIYENEDDYQETIRFFKEFKDV